MEVNKKGSVETIIFSCELRIPAKSTNNTKIPNKISPVSMTFLLGLTMEYSNTNSPMAGPIIKGCSKEESFDLKINSD